MFKYQTVALVLFNAIQLICRLQRNPIHKDNDIVCCAISKTNLQNNTKNSL